MSSSFKAYTSDDFIRVRDFLITSYSEVQYYNWMIDRWNFCSALSRIMNGVSEAEYASRIGLWEKEGELVAIANWEGERRAEAFFQVSEKAMDQALLWEMFQYAEEHLSYPVENQKRVRLRIPEGDALREDMAIKRGYELTEHIETVSKYDIENILPVLLPMGYTFRTGDQVSPVDKGMAHGFAFGYHDEEKYISRSQKGYKELAGTPDYDPELDLYVISPDGNIAAFCTMWYDATNRHGILEPVGTHPKYRKKGLAKAVIFEAINRIRKRGAAVCYVGSDQQFYNKIGFTPVAISRIWEKTIKE